MFTFSAISVISMLFGIGFGYGFFLRRFRRNEQLVSMFVENIENFAWALNRDPTRRYPGESSPPMIYVLPGGGRTNSCDQARIEWLSAASEARDYLVEISRGSERDAMREEALIRATKSVVDGTMEESRASIEWMT